MIIEYGKTLNDEQTKVVKNISESCNILFDTARLLFYRNIDTVQKAERFLNPGKKRFYDAFLLGGVKQAVERIEFAKLHNQKVLVFGDYDADGICATATLYYCLKEYGVNAMISVPEREDGYGLNVDKINGIKSEHGLDLIITVDCGISEKNAISSFMQNGVDVIVTDHHEPPAELPECILINPKTKGNGYPFDGLCGTGVAYKLGYALIGSRADKYLDLVALATVADSMELIDENRDIVYEGLKIFNSNSLRPALKYMLNDSQRVVTAQTIAYQVAPRVNAGGRMGDADCGLRLFTSESESEIYDCAVKLNQYNLARQTECDLIYRQAKQKIIDGGYYKDEMILCYDESWKTGFVGIVASRLVEEYNRPVIVFAGADGYLKGSARSVDGLNVFNAIAYAEEYLLGYGGHSQAAGVSVDAVNFENLRRKLCEYVKISGCAFNKEKTVMVDMNLTSSVSMRFAKEIQALEPFGVGNRKPLFTVVKNSVNSAPMKVNSPHYTFSVPEIDMLDFNGEKDKSVLALPVKKHVVFEINYSVFRGVQSVKGIVKNVVLDSDLTDADLFVFENQITGILKEDTAKPEQKVGQLKQGFGTLYVLSNVKTLQKIKTDLKVSMFTPDTLNGENCIVVCPTSIPDNYTKIEYLDYPLSTVSCDIPVSVNLLGLGCEYVDRLSVERSDFAEIYNYLINSKGKKFTSAWEFYLHNKVTFDAYNFIFATRVFIELGFFDIESGVLKTGKIQKKPLINSLIYSKIVSLKG